MRISSAVSLLLLLASASAQRGGTGSGPLLGGLTGWANGDVVWHDPPSGWGSCGKVTTVFGVPICASTAAWAASPSKANHVAHVFYQLLDNDADGVPDDSLLHSHMVSKGYLLWVPSTESDSSNDGSWPSSVGQTQMTGIWETFPNTCDAPANRGASATDRGTWGAAVDNTSGCDTSRDATTEEILHLMTHAAGELYPALWGPSFSSTAGAALSAANGNCGWGYLRNYIDPSSNNCQGQFAYDDTTCNEECNVVEGIYWASVSYIGGLYTTTSTNLAKNEWLMATPDAFMSVYPSGVSNAISLETGSPALYALVSDTTSTGHAWLPAIMPDGRYEGNPGGPPGPPPPTPSPPAPPTKSPPPPPTRPPPPPTRPPPPPTPSPPTPSPPGNGEEACENKDFSRSECVAVGCCEWIDRECWSAVGTDTCSGPGDDLCVECSDNETPWMERNDRDCDSSDQVLSRNCNQSNNWTRMSVCQKSCYDMGLGYEGVTCCSDESGYESGYEYESGYIDRKLLRGVHGK